ncbi:hypothetical protein RKD54_000308 [Pseudarthrobacter sp. SLBN-100]|uniref:hypothetical protein n=1 Tax=Arthrobacter sp. SLBN-100 TaxID=2768450 RepID=UPI001F2E1DFD|nr:hypothetical protein [Arthrobacter sp. SLBN-100]
MTRGIRRPMVNWGCHFAAERLGPLMQASVPTPATAMQLAASITFMLSTMAPTSSALSQRQTAAGRHRRGAAAN